MIRGIQGVLRRSWFISLAVVTTSVQAQEHLLVSVDEIQLGYWTVTAELLNPDPDKDLLAVVSMFYVSMDGSGFDSLNYNNQFDSDFAGPITVIVEDDYVEFWGYQWLPPANNADGPDSSNPLWAFSFEADRVDSLDFIGDVNGAYAGSPFPEVFYFHHPDGSPADFGYTIEINPIPSPGTIALIGVSGYWCLRGRRR